MPALPPLFSSCDNFDFEFSPPFPRHGVVCQRQKRQMPRYARHAYCLITPWAIYWAILRLFSPYCFTYFASFRFRHALAILWDDDAAILLLIFRWYLFISSSGCSSSAISLHISLMPSCLILIYWLLLLVIDSWHYAFHIAARCALMLEARDWCLMPLFDLRYALYYARLCLRWYAMLSLFCRRSFSSISLPRFHFVFSSSYSIKSHELPWRPFVDVTITFPLITLLNVSFEWLWDFLHLHAHFSCHWYIFFSCRHLLVWCQALRHYFVYWLPPQSFSALMRHYFYYYRWWYFLRRVYHLSFFCLMVTISLYCHITLVIFSHCLLLTCRHARCLVCYYIDYAYWLFAIYVTCCWLLLSFTFSLFIYAISYQIFSSALPITISSFAIFRRPPSHFISACFLIFAIDETLRLRCHICHCIAALYHFVSYSSTPFISFVSLSFNHIYFHIYFITLLYYWCHHQITISSDITSFIIDYIFRLPIIYYYAYIFTPFHFITIYMIFSRYSTESHWSHFPLNFIILCIFHSHHIFIVFIGLFTHWLASFLITYLRFDDISSHGFSISRFSLLYDYAAIISFYWYFCWSSFAIFFCQINIFLFISASHCLYFIVYCIFIISLESHQISHCHQVKNSYLIRLRRLWCRRHVFLRFSRHFSDYWLRGFFRHLSYAIFYLVLRYVYFSPAAEAFTSSTFSSHHHLLHRPEQI